MTRASIYGRVSAETQYAVARAVGEGADTMPAIAKALGTTKTTAAHALQHLTADGYVERHRFEGGRVLYSYSLVRMPPAPKPKRGSVPKTFVPAPDKAERFSTDALNTVLGKPVLPQGRVAVVHLLDKD